MFKAFRFRIYPSKSQSILIDNTIDCVRFIYNKMLEDKIASYDKDKTTLYVTPAQYKEKYDFLRKVDSLALANAQLNLDTAYNLFFKNPKYGHPQFKGKKNAKKSYTTNLVGNNIRLEAGRIKLPKIGFVKIKQHRPIPETYTLKSCTVIKTSTGKYFVAMLYSYEPVIIDGSINTVIGLKSVDNGIRTSSHDIFEYPLNIIQTMTKYKKQMQILSKMQYGSQNYYKQWGRITKIRAKLVNQSNDYLHKVTRQIANAYDCVAIEDMKSKNENMSTILPNLAVNFARILSYKLEELGKRLITISGDKLSTQPTATEIKDIALKTIAV